MLSKNLQAFLDTVAVSELGYGLLDKSDNGYNCLVGSTPQKPLFFQDYETHPNIYNRQCNSTAAGRYQVLYRFYVAYKTMLNLPDFSPESQDKIAIQLIKECRAIPLIEAGHIKEAIQACSSRWASFPGKGNTYGQHINSIDYLVNAFVNAGGVVCVT